MEMSQWNILYSYLKQTKMSLFYHFYIYFRVYIVWDTYPPPTLAFLGRTKMSFVFQN
jgi:hypothetical protein